MNNYFYLDFSIKLQDKLEQVLPVFVKGAIVQSLTTVFGDIGGQTTVDLLKFDESKLKGILRVTSDHHVKVRAAISLIASFQGIPASFQVHKSSQLLLSLLNSS